MKMIGVSLPSVVKRRWSSTPLISGICKSVIRQADCQMLSDRKYSPAEEKVAAA